jgi:hypothetical protein
VAVSAAERDEHPGGIASLTGGSALRTALDRETRLADSLQSDQIVPVVFDSPEQVPGHVVAAPYWGDTALRSGVYLGGESFRYAVAAAHLGHENGPDRGEHSRTSSSSGTAFWRAQRGQALARITAVLRGEHRNVVIAEDWQPATKVPPALNTTDPRGPHTADFGGGVVPGQRGMLMRACTKVGLAAMGITPPNVDAANPVNNNSNNVYEITWGHGDKARYNC